MLERLVEGKAYCVDRKLTREPFAHRRVHRALLPRAGERPPSTEDLELQAHPEGEADPRVRRKARSVSGLDPMDLGSRYPGATCQLTEGHPPPGTLLANLTAQLPGQLVGPPLDVLVPQQINGIEQP